MTGIWMMKKIRYTRSRFRWKMEVAIFVLVVVRVSLKWGGGDGRVGVFAARHQNLERARGSFPAASRLHLHASVATFYQREHHRSISISLDHGPLGSEMFVSQVQGLLTVAETCTDEVPTSLNNWMIAPPSSSHLDILYQLGIEGLVPETEKHSA
jgi:hypothetical protein